jgi:hypothetical protein
VSERGQAPASPSTKRAIVILIQIGIGAFHALRFGRLLSGQWSRLYSSYFSDVVIPFGVYFLLTLSEERIPLFRSWSGKAGAVLVVTTAAEVAQYFGFYALGVTFDPLDIVMYAVGVLLAAFLDVKVFAHHVDGWAGPGRS